MSDYLIQNALWWIGVSGADAFRMDTFPYVDRPFWEKYNAALKRQYPGFVVTGEVTAPNPVALSFFEGGAHGDIARLLRLPLGTVKSRLRLAMARLRNRLGDES